MIFLAEAFTRPRVMEHLARIGFSQSYTYFTWRTTKWELETYLTQLTAPGTAAYFRRTCGRIRLTSSRTNLSTGVGGHSWPGWCWPPPSSANYGIYGPAFELQEHAPRSEGSEEYLRSEKYEVRSWDLDSPTSLADFVAVVNLIRRDHEALQFDDSLRFRGTDNDALIAYSKARQLERPGGAERDVVLTVVNLDHRHVQAGWVTVDLGALGFVDTLPYVAHDLLSGARYVWRGPRTSSVSTRPMCPATSLRSASETPRRGDVR